MALSIGDLNENPMGENRDLSREQSSWSTSKFDGSNL